MSMDESPEAETSALPSVDAELARIRALPLDERATAYEALADRLGVELERSDNDMGRERD